MAKRLLLIVLLASHLFVSRVLSGSILTIENNCNQTVWPVIFSYDSNLSTTGFLLRSGEARILQAPSSWFGLISARTLCSTNSSGYFSCATGDCESGIIELTATQSMSQPSQTCITAGCLVDLNKTCPEDLGLFTGGKQIGCSSACQKYDTKEICCTHDFRSKQRCKTTMYTHNFEQASPLAFSYAFDDNNSTITCPKSTDFVLTFCPSSIPNNTRSSMSPFAGPKNNSQGKLKPILGGSSALAAMIIVVVVVVMVRAKNARRKRDSNYENIEAVVMLKRYSYANVKKMTNSFAHVLGKGGYGTVYKGKLPDSSRQDIALKILKDPKENGEDFINELASMSIASHVNIVSLFGFCYERSKRAIIYEFMPNGSLDKFISEDISTKMDCETLYNIALGVARGIISMLDARGTVGYIAPEVFSKSYGAVSHKSDVYSYGMVVLELIGVTSRDKAETSRSNMSSILLGDHIMEEEEEVVKKMTLVGLWCIQTNPCDRPPMKKVVEMLEGGVEALVVPPKPLLTPAIMAWETVEESEETTSLLSLSQLERF
ncbi:hypothetical protein Bca4012_079907 [Brassica carinata]